MKIFSKDHLLVDVECKTQLDAFKIIAKKAKELGVVDNEKKLIDGLVRREKVSTTGMKDSFAIPHAMQGNVKEPAIIAVRFKNGVDWKAIDNKPVKFAIALLIPEKNLSDLHMEYLARISTALMDEKICNKLLKSNANEVCKLLENAIKVSDKSISITKSSSSKKQNSTKRKKSGINIVGVSACATGIAHTFMSREALEKTGAKLGYNVHIETEGQNGREHELTDELIQNADYVIIAADINVDTERFNGKKIFFCDTNYAINTPEKALKSCIENSKVHSSDYTPNTKEASFTGQKRSKWQTFMKHFLSGVSHMIPVLIFSGIVYAILNACSQAFPVNIDPETGKQIYPDWFQIMLNAANVGFTFFIAIMGAYIAESIGGRSAFAPGLICSFIAGSTDMYFYYPGLPKEVTVGIQGHDVIIKGISLGIIAAIGMGFAAGYMAKYINSFKYNKHVRTLVSLFLIPVIGTSLIVFPFIFLLSGVLGCMMNYIGAGLAIAGSINGVNFLIGFLLGAMVGFDMGGPINKIAVATATCLIEVDPRFMGACAAAIPIAPFACGLTTIIFKKLFDEDDFRNGVTAVSLGFMGISEGAIPIFTKRPKQTVIANVVGSAIAGGCAFLFFVGAHVAMWGGPLIALCGGIYADPGQLQVNIPNFFGGVNQGFAMQYLVNILWFFIAIVIGVVAEVFLYAFLVKRSNKLNKVVKTR